MRASDVSASGRYGTTVTRPRNAAGKIFNSSAVSASRRPSASGASDASAHRLDVRETPDGQQTVHGYDTPEDLCGENAVFGLINTPIAAGQAMAQQSRHRRDAQAARGPDRDRDRAVTQDLIQTLHDQYWWALDDPQASLAGDWAAHTTLASGSSGDAPCPPDEAHARPDRVAVTTSSEADSIEVLLSGAHTLEDCFGPLSDPAGQSDPPDWRVEPVPEILRLFAPPEYHAAAARRLSALPAALARREHHSLGIDSPMSAPGTRSHSDQP
jgi:hypothetical protein